MTRPRLRYSLTPPPQILRRGSVAERLRVWYCGLGGHEVVGPPIRCACCRGRYVGTSWMP